MYMYTYNITIIKPKNGNGNSIYVKYTHLQKKTGTFDFFPA